MVRRFFLHATGRRAWIVLLLLGISGCAAAQPPATTSPARQTRIRCGIDVLEAHDFAELRQPGKTVGHVGLITNQTGIDAAGRRTVDVLAAARGLKLAAVFSPEHGIQGKLDTTKIDNARDAATGAPIYSVYGASSAQRHPSPDVVRSLDVLVFDLQDAGTRFYTYETTLGYFLEAAAAAHKPIVVLDRPNPLNGRDVQGPLSDIGRETFTNYMSLPVRHGMTLGELARYFNAERAIHADLRVVPMQGWLRAAWFDATGLAWIAPSPNLRRLAAATLYPGVGLLEMTNVSVGRGTASPFELLGAPWIQADELARDLNRRAIAGVRFEAVAFTPQASVFAQQKCQGVRIAITDRDALDAPELGLELTAALLKLYPRQFATEKLDQLLRNARIAHALLTGEDPRQLRPQWKIDIDEFMKKRAHYLLY